MQVDGTSHLMPFFHTDPVYNVPKAPLSTWLNTFMYATISYCSKIIHGQRDRGKVLYKMPLFDVHAL